MTFATRLAASLAGSLLGTMPLLCAELRTEPQQVTVHEWGTFTSIATETGVPARWAPLLGPGDLPCFVERLGSPTFKDVASGLVRMETPVLYFYSQTPATLSVRVGFPQGWITEWYPKASGVTPADVGTTMPSRFSGGEIRWEDVRVEPVANPILPVTRSSSHYFAARETGAAPIRVGSQWEKMLFYRGIGDFSIPLRPVIDGTRLRINNSGPEAVPFVMLLENRGGKVGYRVARDLRGEVEISLPELTGNLANLRSELAEHLVEFGLFPAEAAAMIETWRDSWFEEGMRLFYIVPRPMVDRLLPLDVKPSPANISRVFVGRIELLSRGMQDRIESLSAANDVNALQDMGRFLGPFVTQMERTRPRWSRPAAVQSVFQRRRVAPGCVN
jgi:hypothetical protein